MGAPFPPPPSPGLSRRTLLRLGAASALTLLAGCERQELLLLGSRGDLPAAWVRRLPKPWRSELLEDPAQVLARAAAPLTGLVQLSDGWAAELRTGDLQPIGTPALIERFAPMAAPLARLHGPPGAGPLAFPWSYGPWVLVLRSRPDLARRRAEGWDLLLDPSLAGRLVLPSSPRVTIALVGEDPERLRRLRRSALAYDERDGLSLLLTGEAEAAVLPRQRVVGLLRRDPRLQVLLPEGGAPLSWNLLLRPAGPHPEPPLEWLGEALEPPLLPALLTGGWVPPLPRDQLQRALAEFPAAIAALLLPPQSVLERCFSLPPLAAAERRRLQQLWDGAAPAPGA
ncbi:MULTISPECIES: twin-arginine translocation pathway signal [unclassified Cyanobium]|uniref:twin-arginine translocation pathway signal n=1 Tax=unclassified Cyanobium TaxID=2627006 RepID=UPI0020CBB26C|nr:MULTISPECIES: twin-arginine translocation pathway signal [unclassified Cyanobium]MCP9858396.1 twin-arginine translocation pathway signal [Cyanobium sp. Cruz-8H5]MCP9865520.1 twin-arginine translocation pathway signal [Cyanobium sp. Cruz-8D1]